MGRLIIDEKQYNTILALRDKAEAHLGGFKDGAETTLASFANRVPPDTSPTSPSTATASADPDMTPERILSMFPTPA